ncbi:MAG TPA: 3-chlorobenzoate-3,4-dioxygenase [Planctomycetaceae bacterium]|nr:3-chlorobenzoate-3,4-dioxygenase [Planctomycetaceae bacterium]
MDRRDFLTVSIAGALHVSCCDANESSPLRVAVIGHTGRGDYGHGLDTAWLRIAETQIVAVADADQAGLTAAKKRLRVEAGFLDYRELLETIRPEIVAVCSRHPDQHCDMIVAAAGAGAKAIYVEKPFCRTPAEADAISVACASSGTKLAIAHRNRYHPTLQAIDRLIAAGGIGKPLEIRGRGKGDRRGGAEDLWVLGSHVLNLVHYFGGVAKTCSAVLRQDGQPITAQHVRQGGEALGPIGGNELHARYEMSGGLVAYFDSIAGDGTASEGFGLRIIGSEGVIDIKCDQFPIAHLIPGNPWRKPTEPARWIEITSAGVGKPEPIADLTSEISGHILPIRDLLGTLGTDRQPLCSIEEGAMTVEMICATFASHRAEGRRVEIPLANRENELTNL